MQNIGIFVNQERDKGLDATHHVAQALISRGMKILLDEELKDRLNLDTQFVSKSELFEKAELVVALGGDGTILKIARDAAAHNVPILGINIGHLGFLAQAEKGDDDIFDKIANDEFIVNPTMMLEAKVCGSDVCPDGAVALNDIILRGSEGKMLSLEVLVDGTVTNSYQADGIIISTSTGSTAYSLSCGGPIVHNSLDCMILTPICPHTLKSRCIVVPPESDITLKFDASYCSHADLKVDGMAVATLCAGDTVHISKSTLHAPLVAINDRNYFDVVRKKLSD